MTHNGKSRKKKMIAKSPIPKSELKIQTDALRLALSIGEIQTNELGMQLKNAKFKTLNTKNQKKFIENEASWKYLLNFWDEYKFLCEKIETEKLEYIPFFLTFLRSLMETYGELLFFLNQTDRQKLGIFMGQYLLYLRDAHYAAPTQTLGIKQAYEEYLNLMKPILNDEKIAFPLDIKNFSMTALRKTGFAFPPFDQIFKKNYFATLSKKTFSCWPKDRNSSTFYDKYYRIYSSYTHKSFTNSPRGATGNELLWMIQFMYIMGQLMLELSDAKIFNGQHKANYNAFTGKIAEVYPRLIKIWEQRTTSSISEL
jgi:hypothetical protein